MKKIALCLGAVLLICALAGCSSSTLKIESYSWELGKALLTEGETLSVVAVGADDPAHPEAQVVDITLTAENGVLTITDSTNGVTYEGSYKLVSSTAKERSYQIQIGTETGLCTVAMTNYADGSETPTLPISLGEHTLQFYAK